MMGNMMLKRNGLLCLVVSFVMVMMGDGFVGEVVGSVVGDEKFERVVLKEGKDTSYVVGYVNEKTGRTDYIKYLNNVNGKGVAADDNAAVWVMKMFGKEAMLADMGGNGEADRAENRLLVKRIYRKLGLVGFTGEGVFCEVRDAVVKRLVREGAAVSDKQRAAFEKVKYAEWEAKKQANDKDAEGVLEMLEAVEDEEERRETLAHLERMKRYVANDKPKGRASDLEVRAVFVEREFEDAAVDYDWGKGGVSFGCGLGEKK